MQSSQDDPLFGAGNPSRSEPQRIRIPAALVPRAKLKARLVDLLRSSLYDDANGVVNVEREREIKKLASQLEHEKAYE